MKHQFASVLALGAFGGLLAWTGPCEAQTITVPDGIQNQSPQNPQAGQLQPPVLTMGVKLIVGDPSNGGQFDLHGF